jgi:hypothetical protein
VLPNPIKWALRWFGILPEEGEQPNLDGAAKQSGEASKGIIGYVTGVWDNIKKPMGDAVSYISDFAADAWDKTKDFTAKAWDKAKEAGSWFADSITSMADKTKNMINEWIPKIVDTISGIAGSAMDVLKGIANKIGGWIAGLFSPEEEQKLKETNAKSAEAQSTVSGDKDLTLLLLKENNVQNKWSEMLYVSSQQQVKLLGDLVNIGATSLRELKRMSGNTGSGNVTVVQPSQQSSKQMVTIPNNREGYLSSPYAVG